MGKSGDGSNRAWVLGLSATVAFMVSLDALAVTTALAKIRQDLGASIETLEWTVNAYNLSLAVLLLTGAALGDRFGRRRMFAVGVGLFSIASAACALAGDANLLILARAAQGAGAALAMPLAMALIGAAFAREQRAAALGALASVTGVALIVGPLAGGAIAQGLDWRWIFWINVPIGLAVIPLTFARMPESFGPKAHLDIPGLALATSATLALVWGLMRGNGAGWASAEVPAALAIGVALAIAFVAFELRAAEPMTPMRLFRSRAFCAGIAVGFLFYSAIYGTLFFIPQFLQTAQGGSPLEAGIRLLPWTATVFCVSPFAGRLAGRIGERALVVCGMLIQGVGLVWVALIASPNCAYGALAAPLLIAGIGASMAQPTAQSAVLNAVAAGDIGKASGLFNVARFLGGAFGIAILVAAFGLAGNVTSPRGFSVGFSAAMAVACAFALAGAAIGLLLPQRRPGGAASVASISDGTLAAPRLEGS